MSKLFEDESEGELELKTDTDYAKKYNNWRQKEELHKLQARYGDISSNSESSSDEDDEPPDENFEDFFKTLSCIKNKDNKVYDKNFDFFANAKESESSKSNKKKKKDQPMYIKDYERKLILEKGGQLSDDEDNEDDQHSKPFTYNDEQNEIKENLKNALKNIDDDDYELENWSGGLFKTREKTTQEKQNEDNEYLQWLAGQSENLKNENDETELKSLKQFWNDPKLEEGEKFLRDYIIKKRFLESEDADYVPTYDEIIHDSDEDLREDEKAIDKQEEFEHKYNFRFEEPDQEFIKRYPRTMENSLRQKDDKRKIKRVERRERKTEEKKQKMEEINKLKELKKLEIEDKIKKLKEITGNTEIAFDVKDLEDDFDPDEHDKRMQNLFNEEFYDGPETEQKPEFPDLDEELEIENWDRWHGNDGNEQAAETDKSDEPHCEDETFNMDCDYDPAVTQQELIDNSKRRKKRRRKSKFAEVLSEPKPVFDPNDHTYQEYLDEYYKLDCEDIIGDIPCRFKYRKVIPNDFGLTVEEILNAKDKELNRWCSLKRALQYRPEHVEKYDVIAFSKRGQNINLKRKYLPSLFENEDPNIAATSSSNTETITRTKLTIKENTTYPREQNAAESINMEVLETNTHKKKNKKKTKSEISDNRNQAESINKPTDTNQTIAENNKNKKKKKQVNSKSESLTNSSVINSEKNKNKKRKRVGDQETEHVSKPKKHKRDSLNNKNIKGKKIDPDVGISDARLTAYGFKPKKFKNKLKYGTVK